MKTWIVGLIMTLGWAGVSHAQNSEIEWLSFEEAVELDSKDSKKFFIDFYTSWCGWCKRLDAVTFKDAEVVDLINEYYYPVKFDAEQKETINFGGTDYVFVKPPTSRRGYHELAATIMQGKMSYPTMVILDVHEDEGQVEIITPIQGYLDGTKLEPILNYLGEDMHLQQVNWEQYRANYAARNSNE